MAVDARGVGSDGGGVFPEFDARAVQVCAEMVGGLGVAAGGGGVVRGRVRHRQAITSGSGGRQIASDEESHSSLALTWATNVLSADATIVIDSSGWR